MLAKGDAKEIPMRIARLFVAAALMAAAAPSLAGAQVESTPIPAPGKPNFSAMNFLIGTWTCSTKSSRRPAAYSMVSTYTMDPTGYWIEETSTTNKTSWSPKLTIMDKYTYDPDTHRWADVTYGDQGTFGLAFSSGWDGSKIIWHDVSFAPGPNVTAQSNVTNTKVSDGKYTTASTFTETKTSRVVSVTGVCTKR